MRNRDNFSRERLAEVWAKHEDPLYYQQPPAQRTPMSAIAEEEWPDKRRFTARKYGMDSQTDNEWLRGGGIPAQVRFARLRRQP